MKKKLPIIITIVVVIIILIITLIVLNKKNSNTGNEIDGTSISEVKGATEIKLNEETEINTLKEINISGTNDYFSITQEFKFEIPDYQEGLAVSFAIQIPYKFIVDGEEYEGAYQLGDGKHISIDDGNPKYDLEIINLTNDGIVKVLIKEK